MVFRNNKGIANFEHEKEVHDSVRKRLNLILACICACVFALALSACATTQTSNTSANTEQSANRTYMASVNQIMTNVDSDLEDFVDAVSRNDLVNMRTQADKAFTELDQLNSLDVPDEMSDIQAKYVEGATKLKNALNDYINLYTDVQNGTVDDATYNTRIQSIQAEYDAGIAALQEGDQIASEKE